MCLMVCYIVELIGLDCVIWFGFGQFGGQMVGIMYIVVGVFVGCSWNFDQFGFGKVQYVFFFLILCFGDYDD